MFLSGPRFPAAGRPPRAFLPRQRLYLSRLRRGVKERTAALERSQLQWCSAVIFRQLAICSQLAISIYE